MERRWLSRGLLLAGACSLAVACGGDGDEGDAPCQSGTGRYCTCTDGSEGTQLCIGDTGEWAPCDCSGGHTGGAGGLGSGGSDQVGGADGSGEAANVGGSVGLGGATGSGGQDATGGSGLDTGGAGGSVVDTGGTGGDGSGGRALLGGSAGVVGAAGADACPVGTELCPCGPGGACDGNLVCGSGLCVDIGSGGTAGAPGAGGHTGTAGTAGSVGSGGAEGGQAGAATGTGGGGGAAGGTPATGGAGGCADTVCGTACVDLLTSNEHCGGCEDPCTGGQFCALGNCECPEGDEWCTDICTDTDFDETHCGDCDVACGGSDLCLTGRCRTSEYDLSLYHQTDPVNNQFLSPRFEICNATDTAVPLTELTVRYWYTADGTSAEPCNWEGAAAGCQGAEVWAGETFTTAAIQTVGPARNQADYVLVLTFSSGEIAPFDCSDEIFIGLHGNYSTYDTGNDWSFSSATTFTLNDHVTVYRSNSLIWGTEPG